MGSTRSKRGVLHTTCGLELFTQYLATLETRDGEAVDTLVSFTEPHKTTLDHTRRDEAADTLVSWIRGGGVPPRPPLSFLTQVASSSKTQESEREPWNIKLLKYAIPLEVFLKWPSRSFSHWAGSNFLDRIVGGLFSEIVSDNSVCYQAIKVKCKISKPTVYVLKRADYIAFCNLCSFTILK